MTCCASCGEPLLLRLDMGSDGPAEGSSSQANNQDIPDDVELSCGCHFHWQCILDAYEVTQCPNCGNNISTSSATNELQILCTLRNEGGVQRDLDILPILSEELYLKAYPDDRKPRAFLEFCREGDLEAIVDLLKASDDDDEGDEEVEDDMELGEDAESVDTPDAATVLRYQDPIGEMQSALHIAVRTNSPEIVWMLLLLASTLDEQQFPTKVFEVAKELDIARESQEGRSDIRTLKDANGHTAAHYASDKLGIPASVLTA